MVRPERELLSGVVELDQSFLGGRSHAKAGGSTEKAPITIAVKRLPNGRLGRARLDLAEVPNGVDQVEFACDVIAPGTEIHTDGAWLLTRLSDNGFTHHRTPSYLATDLDAVMPGPHLVSSLLKRWTAGTLHHRISRQHLPYYLDEFTFRFNRRTSRARGLLFYRLLQQAAGTDPHPLSELIGGIGNDWTNPQTTERQLHSSRYAGNRCDSSRGWWLRTEQPCRHHRDRTDGLSFSSA